MKEKEKNKINVYQQMNVWKIWKKCSNGRRRREKYVKWYKKGDCLEKIYVTAPWKFLFLTTRKTNEMKNQLLLCWKNKLGKKNGDKTEENVLPIIHKISMRWCTKKKFYRFAVMNVKIFSYTVHLRRRRSLSFFFCVELCSLSL